MRRESWQSIDMSHFGAAFSQDLWISLVLRRNVGSLIMSLCVIVHVHPCAFLSASQRKNHSNHFCWRQAEIISLRPEQMKPNTVPHTSQG